MSNLFKSDPAVLSDPQGLLYEILCTAIDETGATSGSLVLLNPNTGALDIEASIGLSEKAQRMKLRQGEGITGWVASSGKVLRIGDVTKDRRYVPLDGNTCSELAVPLTMGDQVIGVVNVDHKRAHAFTDEHERFMVEWAEDSVKWIRHAWSINQLKGKAAQLETLVDMGQSLVSEDSLDSVLKRVAEDAHHLMRARLSSITLVSESGEELILRAWHGASDEYVEKPNLNISESLVGVVVRRLKPLTVLNVQDHQQFHHTELARREGLVSLLSVPLSFQGKALGAMSIYTSKLHRFSNEEIRMMNALAGLAAVAITKAQFLERVVRVEEDLKATERLSALGWLAAEIAHEIRNPLTVVQMLFHSMVRSLELDETASRDASLIENKMQQMNKILDQVLTFARSSEPRMERLDATKIIEDIALLVRHKLAEQQVNVVKELPDHPSWFMGDRSQIEQALLNLVLNGAQSMGEGGTLTIRVGYQSGEDESQADRVLIEVADTGEGLSSKRKEELFQPFLTYRPGGTGLGLALVQKTVKSHNGEISVESEFGMGATFTMSFPALQD